jgi:hypothetical protein
MPEIRKMRTQTSCASGHVDNQALEIAARYTLKLFRDYVMMPASYELRPHRFYKREKLVLTSFSFLDLGKSQAKL